MNNRDDVIKQIDAVLPQTQCDLCGYGGCQPYAKAIVNDNASIDKCPPGGVDTLEQLAKLTHRDLQPVIADFRKTVKSPRIAVIDENVCIGCTKCIQACPVDAIVGAAKVMHTVITNECTGCELCVAPCPVDCIAIEHLTAPTYQKTKARARFDAREQRLKTLATEKQTRFKQANANHNPTTTQSSDKQAKQEYIRLALQRKRQQYQDPGSYQHEQRKT